MLNDNKSHRRAEISDPDSLRFAGSGHGGRALNIVILGAGEAAWMTAACLSAAFPQALALITVISDGAPHCDFPGDSHQPSFFRLLSNLGITEDEVLRRCDGVFEFGTEFLSGSDKCFVAASEVTPMPMVRRMAGLRRERLTGRLHQYLPQAAAAFLHRAPAGFLGTSELQRFGAYRLSFDGNFFAAMMREYSLGRGVSEIRSSAVSVVCTDDGSIARIQTTHPAGMIDCDLVLCCSEQFRSQLTPDGSATFEESAGKPFRRVSSWSFEANSKTPSFSQAVWQRSGLSVIRWQHSGFSCDTFWSGSHEGKTTAPPDQSSASVWQEFVLSDALNVNEPETRDFSVGRCSRMWDRNLVFLGNAAMVTDPVVHAGRHLCQTACELLLDYLTAGTECFSVVAKEYNRRLAEAFDSWSSLSQFTYGLLTSQQQAERQPDGVNVRVRETPDLASLRVPSGASETELFYLQAAFCAFSNERQLSVVATDATEQQSLEEGLRRMTDSCVGNLPDHSEYLDWIHRLSQRRSA